MTKEKFLAQSDPFYRTIIESLIPLIEKYDKGLSAAVIQFMGTDMLGYTQEGEFKYAFSCHPRHLSFHSMVMYCYPEIHEKFKESLPGGIFKKSCINFRKGEDFPFEEFEIFIRTCATYPYPSSLQKAKKKR